MPKLSTTTIPKNKALVKNYGYPKPFGGGYPFYYSILLPYLRPENYDQLPGDAEKVHLPDVIARYQHRKVDGGEKRPDHKRDYEIISSAVEPHSVEYEPDQH